MSQTSIDQLPHWDFANIYPGLNSPEFTADMQRLTDLIAELDAYLAGPVQQAGPQAEASVLAETAGELIERLNTAYLLGSHPAGLPDRLYRGRFVQQRSPPDRVAVPGDWLAPGRAEHALPQLGRAGGRPPARDPGGQ
jgi:hypothetical protein